MSRGKGHTGIIAVEAFDYEIIEQIYNPHDNLTLNVTAFSDGRLEKEILADIAEALTGDFRNKVHKRRLEEVFSHPELKMVSFTITEKGYVLTGAEEDLLAGPEEARYVMAVLAALMYRRFQAGEYPVTCSLKIPFPTDEFLRMKPGGSGIWTGTR